MASTGTEVSSLADPIVDIGIPTLGDSPYLLEAVESVLTQTLSSWRLVISENGPGTERTRRALESYLQDPRIHHVVTGKRVGRGENFTNLIRAGRAPYVGILHDDDRWDRQFLERRVEFLERHRSCGFVYSGYNVIDATGHAFGRSNPPFPPGVHLSEVFLPRLYRGCFIGPPTVLVRRTAYETVGTTYAELLVSDWEMWLRLAARFDAGCLGVWDADYRLHPGQTSANRATLAEHYLRVIDVTDTLPVSRSLRKAVRADLLVLCALDAVERGERRRAVEYLATALRTDALELMRPRGGARALAAAAALATGASGRRVLANTRERRWWTGGAEGFLPPQSAVPSQSGLRVRLSTADRAVSRYRAPKIYVATLMRPGYGTGVQTHSNRFVRFLRSRQIAARYVTPFSASRFLVFPVFGVRWLINPFSGPLSVWWYRQWHGKLLERVLASELRHEECPVVVYAQCPVSAAAALRARQSREQRVVMAVHFNVSQADEWADKGRLTPGDRIYQQIRALEAEILPRLDGMVYVSEFMRRQLEDRFPALQGMRSCVIPNFLDLPPARDPAPSSGDLVTVGTLEPRKNQAYLLEILSAARRMGHRYSLTLIGDGPDRKMLENLAHHAGIRDQLRFLGFRADAATLVGEHRLYCHAARMENFGFAILEAMAQAVPVVATPVGGTAEVFEAGVEGIFWPLDDAEEAARRLIGLMGDPSTLSAMGAAGRRRVAQRFTTDIVGQELFDFLADDG